MSRISALIFDLDGTLIDSVQDIADAVNYTLRQLDLPQRSLSEIQQFVGDGVKLLLERATQDPQMVQRAVEIFQPYYLQHCADKTILYPGVADTLHLLRGKAMAVASNKPHAMVERTLQQFKIRSCFKIALGGDSTTNRKPHPEPLLKILNIFNCKPEEVLMVGDGIPDLEAAQAAGLRTCAVTYGYRRREELEKYHPDFWLDHFADLEKILGSAQ